MNDKLDLSIPDANKEPHSPKQRFYSVLLACVLVMSAANLAVVWMNAGKTGKSRFEAVALSAESQKQLALKLENQGLKEPATKAWKEYLAITEPGNEQSARIWYRIGKLYQDARDYEQALDSYYRSESFARIPEIATEISRSTEECLESMGKFAALRYELADRVEFNSSSNATGSVVVAEIGPRKITRAELDSMIEAQIQRQLSQLASFLPPDEKNRQKEQMLKQFSTSEQRKLFLHQYILQEILSRKAREMKLTETPDVRAMLEDQERSLLARQVIEKECSDQIKITMGDLQTYYQAHAKDYKEDERASISHILVSTEAAAKTTLDRALGGEEFGKLAKELSKDKTTREKGGKLSGWAEKDGSIPGIGYAADAQALIFSTDPEHVCTNFVKSAMGYHIIKVREQQPERQNLFKEVQQQVFRALRGQKESEVQKGLMAGLESRYNVVIHESTFVPTTEIKAKQ